MLEPRCPPNSPSTRAGGRRSDVAVAPSVPGDTSTSASVTDSLGVCPATAYFPNRGQQTPWAGIGHTSAYVCIIPCRDQRALPNANRVTCRQMAGSKSCLNILFVDDERIILATLADDLTEPGWPCWQCCTRVARNGPSSYDRTWRDEDGA